MKMSIVALGYWLTCLDMDKRNLQYVNRECFENPIQYI